jgi:hypothetical protein
MLKRVTMFITLPICAFLSLLAYSQGQQSPKDLKGSIVGENVYANPALGMKITLPGSWDLLPPDPTQSHSSSDCQGPLCGNPEINLILQTKADSNPAYRVYLSGYRLSPQYLNRDRNPLSKFAEVMLAGSLAGNGLVPIGTQSAIQLDGKPAYRLLVGKPGETVPRMIGYVSEANQYVFMFVIIARNSSPQALQSAIEATKFSSSAR